MKYKPETLQRSWLTSCVINRFFSRNRIIGCESTHVAPSTVPYLRKHKRSERCSPHAIQYSIRKSPILQLVMPHCLRDTQHIPCNDRSRNVFGNVPRRRLQPRSHNMTVRKRLSERVRRRVENHRWVIDVEEACFVFVRICVKEGVVNATPVRKVTINRAEADLQDAYLEGQTR